MQFQKEMYVNFEKPRKDPNQRKKILKGSDAPITPLA